MHAHYKYFVSPFLGDACRFVPSCSDYCIKAITQHGYLRGLSLSLKRIFRCHPYCHGGIDPVPPI